MCYSPINIKDKTGVSCYGYIQVPCGKCYECRAARSAAWAFRLNQEDKRYYGNSRFFTLTYSDKSLPLTPTLLPTLQKRDLQLFFKRLRKKSVGKIKYYACGEYGSTTQRPHYHAIIFGSNFEDVYDSWMLGNVREDQVSLASIRYVTNYLQKSVDTDLYDRQPEFALMSKKLGIGYLTDAAIAWHRIDQKNYVQNLGGSKQALPRYYREKIFDESERRQIAAKHATEHETEYQRLQEKFGHVQYELNRLQNVKTFIATKKFKEKNRSKL